LFHYRSILDLPEEVLTEIIKCLPNDDTITLSTVNKTFRRLALHSLHEFDISASVVTETCCLTNMVALKKLTLVHTCDTGDQGDDSEAMGQLLCLVTNGHLTNLHTLELCGMYFSFTVLLQIVVTLPGLTTLSTHRSCSQLSVAYVENLVQCKKGLKFISGQMDITNREDLYKLAQLLNSFAGKITFGHDIIDQIPKSMLEHPRASYSCPYPSGLY
jgi:hypothetical protein